MYSTDPVMLWDVGKMVYNDRIREAEAFRLARKYRNTRQARIRRNTLLLLISRLRLRKPINATASAY